MKGGGIQRKATGIRFFRGGNEGLLLFGNESQGQRKEKNMNELVMIRDRQAITTSLKVAEVFEKRHDHILRDIKELEIPDGFRLPNFGETTYVDKWNREQPMCVMTRDGFTLLAMGFTGAKAMKFKVDYINAFNRMETELRGAIPQIPKSIMLEHEEYDRDIIGDRPVIYIDTDMFFSKLPVGRLLMSLAQRVSELEGSRKKPAVRKQLVRRDPYPLDIQEPISAAQFGDMINAHPRTIRAWARDRPDRIAAYGVKSMRVLMAKGSRKYLFKKTEHADERTGLTNHGTEQSRYSGSDLPARTDCPAVGITQ